MSSATAMSELDYSTLFYGAMLVLCVLLIKKILDKEKISNLWLACFTGFQLFMILISVLHHELFNLTLLSICPIRQGYPNSSSSPSPKLPVSGHKLANAEFGAPSAMIGKEGFQIDTTVPDHQIVVKMLAPPVNPFDINTIQGTYPVQPANFPAVPGNEGVGVVIKAVGVPGIANRFEEGDWVIHKGLRIGTWQAFVNGSNEDFIKIPKMDVVSAATTIVNPCTAFKLLQDFETLEPADCVIQNGGNPAVGQTAIQFCREFGLKCVSLVRPREGFKQLKVKAKLLTVGNSDTIVITDEGLSGMGKDFKAFLALKCYEIF